MTYDPCGALYVGRNGTTMRCYSRGQARYGGRCKGCADPVVEPPSTLSRPRCGYRGATTRSSSACMNYVDRAGARCGRHTPEALARSAQLLRRDLEQELVVLEARRVRTAKQTAKVQAQLAALGEQQEAAE